MPQATILRVWFRSVVAQAVPVGRRWPGPALAENPVRPGVGLLAVGCGGFDRDRGGGEGGRRSLGEGSRRSLGRGWSAVLLRLAYLGVTNVFAMFRLLPTSDRSKEVEILVLRH